MTDPFIHAHAICETSTVGAGTRIWAFAHILPEARIGNDCNICDGVFIEGDVVVGDRVTVKCGVQLWDGVRLEDDVFVGPNATFTNDPMPRSRRWLDSYPTTIVRKGASIGANATILPGLEIGRGAVVGAGAVVTRSVPPNAIVTGNPARIRGYADATSPTAAPVSRDLGAGPGITPLGVGDAHLLTMAEFGDLRGRLSVGDLPTPGVPFTVARWFFVYDVPSRAVRGEHAHRVCHQFLMCVCGTVKIAVDDGTNRSEVLLDDLTVGLYVPPMVWASQYRYEADTKLLVFASHPYDPDDYIREYEEFLAEAVHHR